MSGEYMRVNCPVVEMFTGKPGNCSGVENIWVPIQDYKSLYVQHL